MTFRDREGEGEGELDLSGSLPARPEQPYDPEPQRERLRGQLALGLVIILGATVLGAFLLIALQRTDSATVKDWLGVVFPPLVALTGSALGFYFGGQKRGA